MGSLNFEESERKTTRPTTKFYPNDKTQFVWPNGACKCKRSNYITTTMKTTKDLVSYIQNYVLYIPSFQLKMEIFFLLVPMENVMNNETTTTKKTNFMFN